MATKRTDDVTRWGTGVGRNLTAAEVDINFWDLEEAVSDLLTTRPQPNDIVSVTVTGSDMTIYLTDGTAIGPITLPVAAMHWRNEWAPFTIYEVLDFITVETDGIFSVEIKHTSAASFDPDLLSDGYLVYRKVWDFGSEGSTGAVYDIGFFFQDRLSTSVTNRLWEMISVRELLLPAAGDQHEAALSVAPATSAQAMQLFHNGTVIGHIDFAIGANAGTVTINADATIAKGDRLELGTPALVDATAQGLTVMLAAQRVT